MRSACVLLKRSRHGEAALAGAIRISYSAVQPENFPRDNRWVEVREWRDEHCWLLSGILHWCLIEDCGSAHQSD